MSIEKKNTTKTQNEDFTLTSPATETYHQDKPLTNDEPVREYGRLDNDRN